MLTCCNSEISAQRATCEPEVSMICWKLFWQLIASAYHDTAAESVEGLKGYSMFCLYMTMGRWLILCQRSLPPLSFSLLLAVSLSVCVSLWLWGIVREKQCYCMSSQCLEIQGKKKKKKTGQTESDLIWRETAQVSVVSVKCTSTCTSHTDFERQPLVFQSKT